MLLSARSATAKVDGNICSQHVMHQYQTCQVEHTVRRLRADWSTAHLCPNVPAVSSLGQKQRRPDADTAIGAASSRDAWSATDSLTLLPLIHDDPETIICFLPVQMRGGGENTTEF